MSMSRRAALPLAVLAAVTVAGCTNDPVPAPGPSPEVRSGSVVVAATTSAATAVPPALLTPPPVVAGELSRRVLRQQDGRPANETVLRDNARAGQSYWLHAACTSSAPGRTLSVEVRSGEPGASGEATTAVDVSCDGAVTVVALAELPAASFAVYTRGDHSGVLSGYAVLAPVPSLPRAE
jgi:hypothetical protein